ncbi:hypothetical protein O181_057037 [Austropuccinia psidii MF-1]|uniref:Uncharacterized protein n=1 Tax=Austropuccinia psidii MF-1 TaxID=1389203 RepID=A0A9Q3EGZ3_9BASI|nr:hypothetical protein [Austropuccinia psidii MF-1]
MALADRILISTIIHECHDSIASGHLSEDRTLEGEKPALGGKIGETMFQNTSKPVINVKKKTEPKERNFLIMIKIQEQKSPWEIVHIDWVTALHPGGDRSYNAFLMSVDRYRNGAIFLPCHND